MERKSILIELGTEELPPKALTELAQSLSSNIVGGLVRRGLQFDQHGVRVYWTPRRMAVYVPAVETAQAERSAERRGPALSAALDAAGNPSKALLGFAQSCGVAVEALEKLQTDKGVWFVHRSTQPGVALSTLLPTLVNEAVAALPIPKPMRWGNRDVAFVRPLHWLVMLLGDQVVEGEVLGIKSDRFSRGHRFHHSKPVWIAQPEDYVETLRHAHVLADPEERVQRIRDALSACAAELGGQVPIPAALLEEVSNLTEWPSAIVCAFEREFLRVPQEALIQTMEVNQRFFPVLDQDGKLTERFIGVANIDSSNPAEIRKGYERVIRPRFADAAFFYDADLKTPLADHQAALKNTLFQQKLGTIWQKCERVAELARTIAGRLQVDAAQAVRAAALSKCDLMTRMVGEFPELQGVMGRYYANAQGEAAEVAAALDQFYAPRYAGDAIPTGKVAQVLAIAERLDTLAGIFAAGLKPSGNKDPFALRRAGLGLARILIEGGHDLDLTALLHEALERVVDQCPALSVNGKAPDRRALAEELYDFVLDRLRGYYADLGVSGSVFDAVASLRPTSLLDFHARVLAIVEFAKLPEAASLAAANKRIRNILRKAEQEIPQAVRAELLAAGAEVELAQAIEAAARDVAPAVEGRDYLASLSRLAQLQAPVDRYFDQVMVMADDAALRGNRLALLKRLSDLFLAIGDVAVLAAT